ncbi:MULTISPECIES: DUF1430 domain-containing protein [Lactococcus]|uniref:DUF1430 domain-containing protein n=2 Tax=Streptococcaceae TaxID=1300 RepID=UPI00203F9788|nr:MULTISPECIES: DUF1430 domain-containing protein [Lactococcus]
MNKVLKITLLLLFSLVSVMLAYMRFNDIEADRLMRYVSKPTYTQVYPPEVSEGERYETNDVKILERKDFISVIEEVSRAFNTPFTVRSRFIGADYDGKGNIYFSRPMANITYFQTAYKKQNQREFTDYGAKVMVSNEPLKNLTDEQYQGAAIFFESDVKEKILDALSEKINQRFNLATSSSSLTSQPEWYNPLPLITRGNDMYRFLIKMILFFYFIFLLVWMVLRSKEIAIYALNGMGNWEILLRIYMRSFLFVQLFVGLLNSIFLLKTFDFQYLISHGLLMGLSLLLVILVIGIVSRASLVAQTNNKSFLKRVHVSVYLVKVYIFAASVSTSMGIILLLNSSLGLMHKTPLDDYGVFAGWNLGYSEAKDNSIHIEIFKYIENNGGLHAAKKLLGHDKLKDYQGVEINSAYLDKYSVRDRENNPIHIDKSTKEAVILVNERYKSKVEEIKKAYNDLLEMQGAWFRATEIKLFLMKDKQSIPIFEGEAGGVYSNGKKQELVADIIEVHTVNNAGVNTYSNMFYGSNTLGVLIPIKESAEKTYLEILPSLKKDKLSSNFVSFVPTSKIAEIEVKRFIGEPITWVFMNILAFVLFILMILSTTVIYFKVNKKKLVLSRVQGISYFRTYKTLFILIVIQNFIFLVHSMLRGHELAIIEAYILYALIELFLVFHLLTRLEKKELVTTLKGA